MPVTPTGLNCRDDKSKMDPIMIMVTEHAYTKSRNDGSYELRLESETMKASRTSGFLFSAVIGRSRI